MKTSFRKYLPLLVTSLLLATTISSRAAIYLQPVEWQDVKNSNANCFEILRKLYDNDYNYVDNNDDEDTRAAKRADLVKALDEARKDYCELLNKYNQEQADAQKDDYKKNVMKCSANDIQRMNLFRNNMIKM